MAVNLQIRPSEILLGTNAPTWWAYQIDAAIFSEADKKDDSDFASISALKALVR